MSTCISQHGEYSSHILDANYVCTRCWALDEDALIAEVERLRAEQAKYDGGEWTTLAGIVTTAGHFWPTGTIQGAGTPSHQRRVWHGPTEPITEGRRCLATSATTTNDHSPKTSPSSTTAHSSTSPANERSCGTRSCAARTSLHHLDGAADD